jgi:hypothetical protein
VKPERRVTQRHLRSRIRADWGSRGRGFESRRSDGVCAGQSRCHSAGRHPLWPEWTNEWTNSPCSWPPSHLREVSGQPSRALQDPGRLAWFYLRPHETEAGEVQQQGYTITEEVQSLIDDQHVGAIRNRPEWLMYSRQGSGSTSLWMPKTGSDAVK